MAGRIVLLKSSLDNIPNYWFSLHHIPKTVCKEMEMIRRKFFWGITDNKDDGRKKLQYIKWDLICSNKCQGGLGLQKLELKNMASLLKWWWKFLTARDRKWMRFIEN